MVRLASNRAARLLAAAFVCAGASFCAHAQAHHTAPPPPPPPVNQQQSAPAPIERQPAHSASANPRANARPTGEHLADWINRHNNLTPEQQQKALETEPGFRDLPASTQQRMRDRLAQLNAMPAEKRTQILQRNEAMEHLSPEQRGQVRDAMKQLADLPPDQRRYVARTFRGLRELPPAQRQAVLNSERFNHLTDAQRSTLNNLMRVEPLLPPPYDSTADVASSPAR